MAARTAAVALGMAAFGGSHLALSHPPVRDALIEKLGQDRFKGFYSLTAAATLLPTCFFYARYGRGAGPRLYDPSASRVARLLGLSFKAAGAVTFSQALMQPNAIVANALSPKSKLSEDDVKVQGIYRVSRHSTFMAFALLGVGNILTRGHLADVLFWSSFPILWVVGSMHQDERLKKRYPASYFENTSLFPGVAIAQGKQSLKQAADEMNPKAAVLALLAPIFFF